MKKIFIQLRDKSGSYHNPQQGLTLSRSDIKEVEYTHHVQRGIANKLFVEVEAPESEPTEEDIEETLRLVTEKIAAEREIERLAKEKEEADKAALEIEAEKAANATDVAEKQIDAESATKETEQDKKATKKA